MAVSNCSSGSLISEQKKTCGYDCSILEGHSVDLEAADLFPSLRLVHHIPNVMIYVILFTKLACDGQAGEML